PVLLHLASPLPADPHHRALPSFPTRRSSDLANAGTHWWDASQIYGDDPVTTRRLRTPLGGQEPLPEGMLYLDHDLIVAIDLGGVDQKSTRLNSSHVKISYAVFCLKKKKKRTK